MERNLRQLSRLCGRSHNPTATVPRPPPLVVQPPGKESAGKRPKESQPAADEDGEVKAEPPVTQPETERGDVESRHHLSAIARRQPSRCCPSLACARTTHMMHATVRM